MREWYLKYGKVVNIDSTSKVNIENWKLYISMVINEEDRGVPVSI